MAELFDKDSDTIGLHLRNIFKEGELDEDSTTEESSVVRQRTVSLHTLWTILPYVFLALRRHSLTVSNTEIK